MVGGVATRTFQYDAAGNITQDIRAGVGTYQYTYNHANRLSTVKLGALDVGTYTYDGLSRLARRIVQNSGSANVNRQYIYDLYGNLIVEADDFGNTVREYIWLAQDIATSTQKTGVVPGFRPIAVVDDVDTSSPKTYHVHVDHVHRPVFMTDSTKAKVWEASYLPFGGVNTITGSAALNARFPGQWFQLESGLHYNWHRHYDATIARYTQPDPLGFIDGPSVYAYVTNSPQMFVDPEGLKGLRTRIANAVAWYFGAEPKKRGGGGKKQHYNPYTGKYTKKTGLSKSPAAWDAYHCSKGYSDARQNPPLFQPPKFASTREKAAYNIGYTSGSVSRWWSSD